MHAGRSLALFPVPSITQARGVVCVIYWGLSQDSPFTSTVQSVQAEDLMHVRCAGLFPPNVHHFLGIDQFLEAK